MRLAMSLPSKKDGAEDRDPREEMSAEVIDLASRTAYPAVTQRRGRSDAMGLAAGVAVVVGVAAGVVVAAAAVAFVVVLELASNTSPPAAPGAPSPCALLVGLAGVVVGAVVFGAVVVGVPLVEEPLEGDWLAAVGGTTAADCVTGRRYSRAVSPSVLASSPSLPGTVMTMLLPCVTTWAPLTPRPFTRELMICCACANCCASGGLPSRVRAVSVTVVPPLRSIPNLGDGLWSPVANTSAYMTITIKAKMPR